MLRLYRDLILLYERAVDADDYSLAAAAFQTEARANTHYGRYFYATAAACRATSRYFAGAHMALIFPDGFRSSLRFPRQRALAVAGAWAGRRRSWRA